MRTMNSSDFGEMFDNLKNWGRWGPDDIKGALNLVTPEKRRQAASLVREGLSVSCALPLATQRGPDNPDPVYHFMESPGSDYLSFRVHGTNNTHLDALCHVHWRGQTYMGRPQETSFTGPTVHSMETPAEEGIISRGVLLDIPRVKNTKWLEPDYAIETSDLDAAENQANLRVEAGDILLVRTGRHLRHREEGKSGVGHENMAGLDLSCGPWLRERDIAVLGGDGINDCFPLQVEGRRANGPGIHMLMLNALGVHILDNCDLEKLAEVCAQLNRWEFLLTITPLRVNSTGMPVNPIAVL